MVIVEADGDTGDFNKSSVLRSVNYGHTWAALKANGADCRELLHRRIFWGLFTHHQQICQRYVAAGFPACSAYTGSFGTYLFTHLFNEVPRT